MWNCYTWYVTLKEGNLRILINWNICTFLFAVLQTVIYTLLFLLLNPVGREVYQCSHYNKSMNFCSILTTFAILLPHRTWWLTWKLRQIYFPIHQKNCQRLCRWLIISPVQFAVWATGFQESWHAAGTLSVCCLDEKCKPNDCSHWVASEISNIRGERISADGSPYLTTAKMSFKYGYFTLMSPSWQKLESYQQITKAVDKTYLIT